MEQLVSGDCAKLLNRLVHLVKRDDRISEHFARPSDINQEIRGLLRELTVMLDADPEQPGTLIGNTGESSLCKETKLTRRESEVLYWLAKGRSVCDVSEIMRISKCTVRTYIQRILEKLDASNRTHAVILALNAGLIKV